MALKKKSNPSFRRVAGSLVVIFFLLVGIGITVSAVQQRQDLLSFAQVIITGCRRIPAGNYNVQVKTYAPTPWEVVCGKKRWSGRLPATNIPFGYRWIPAIYEGRNYIVNTTLKDICALPEALKTGWSDVCQVCQYIDCSKVKIEGEGKVDKINCLLGAYQAEGKGTVKLRYQEGLGCTAKAVYEGKLMGSFVFRPGPVPTLTPAPIPTPTSASPIGALNEKISCDSISGWAGDPDVPNQPIDIHFYADGMYGSGGKMIGSTTANKWREPAVCDRVGGGRGNCKVCDAGKACVQSGRSQCDHGFCFSSIPTWLKDGKNHQIYAYGINAPGTGGGNRLLSGSPMIISCPSPR